MTDVTQSQEQRKSKHFVLVTFGTLGDLHPYLALALELRSRGHHAVIAANVSHRRTVEAEGIDFHAVRPDIADFGEETALMKKFMDTRTGPEFVIRELLMPKLRDSYADISAACEGADMVVTHPLTFAAPLVAAKMRARGLAWASVGIAPTVFLSAYDPPVFAPAPWLRHLRALGPGFYGILLQLLKHRVRAWVEPWHQFRSELGLPPTTANPLFEGQSPELVLALFSPLLAAPQPDWPAHTMMAGFPFYDRSQGREGLDPELDAFLNAGEAPIVFTLGTAAVMDAGDFYTCSAQAAQKLGKRAILLVGREAGNKPANLPHNVVAFDYAPYSLVFPRALAVVHQGGIGTTAQALRAGCPMLVVPYGFDQPDNAARVVRLGVARTIPRPRFNAALATQELDTLLTDERYTKKAAAIGRQLQADDGAAKACDAMEALLCSKEAAPLGALSPSVYGKSLTPASKLT